MPSQKSRNARPKRELPFTQFKNILETITDQIVVFDAERRLVYANAAGSNTTHSIKDIRENDITLGELYKDVEFRDENGDIMAAESLPSAKALHGIATQNNVFEFINRVTHERVWYHTNATPIFDDEGKVAYVIISFRDITLRKKSQDKLKFLVNAMKMLSRTLDPDVLLSETVTIMVPSIADWASIDIWNGGSAKRLAVAHRDPAMVRFLRESAEAYPKNPTTPGNIFELLQDGKARFYPKLEGEPLPESVPAHVREILEKLALSSAIAAPIVSRGKVVGALSLAYAESKRHYSDEDLEFVAEFCNHLGILMENASLYKELGHQNVVKERFLATLSHELRNPLAPIKTSLELLKLKQIEDPDIRREIAMIDRQFDHMTKLLGDLLELSRLTRGKIAINKHIIDLASLVREVVETMLPEITAAGLVLRLSIPDEGIFAVGDPVRITQALTNVLFNAIKFTPRGGTIWLTMAEDRHMTRIRIKDNGIGIAPDMLPYIFNIDIKGNQSGSEKLNDGLGIGLALVRHIMHLHSGSVTAKSEGPGTGSEFTLTIPLSDLHGRPFHAPHERTGFTAAAAPPDTAGFSKNILVVDDNQDAAEALARLLAVLGFKSHAVYSSENALALGQGTDFDAIILDIGMPHMDGYEVARRLREGGYKRLLIALSGYGQPEDKRKARDAGFDHHVTKPLDLERLKMILVEAPVSISQSL